MPATAGALNNPAIGTPMPSAALIHPASTIASSDRHLSDPGKGRQHRPGRTDALSGHQRLTPPPAHARGLADLPATGRTITLAGRKSHRTFQLARPQHASIAAAR
jgi:hypothetical protein